MRVLLLATLALALALAGARPLDRVNDFQDGHEVQASAAGQRRTLLAALTAKTGASLEFQTTEDSVSGVSIIAAALVTDTANSPFTFMRATPTATGTASISADQATLVYKPIRDFFGSDTLLVTVVDIADNTVNITITIVVGAVNDAPVAVAHATTTLEDTIVEINTTAIGTFDVDNSTGITVISAEVMGGTCGTAEIVLPAKTNVRFTPTTNFNGQCVVQYTLTDGIANSTAASITFTITAVNDAPGVTTNSTGSVVEQGSVSLNVTQYGTDVDNGTLLVVGASVLTGCGQVSVEANGNLRFNASAPESRSNQTCVVEYQLSDGIANSTTARVTVTITPENDHPLAFNTTTKVDEDSGISIFNATAITNNRDVDSTGFSLVAAARVSPINCGTVNVAAGNLTFTPAGNFSGACIVSYTLSDTEGLNATAYITFEVAEVNDAPYYSGAAKSYTTDEDIILTVNATFGLLGGAADVDNTTLTVELLTQPASGTLVLNNITGAFTYAPQANFNGTATFLYRISDGVNTSAVNFTATIVIKPVNDAPVAMNDTLTSVLEDALPFTANLVDNDSDVESPNSSLTLVYADIPVARLVGLTTQCATVERINNTHVTVTLETNIFGLCQFAYQVKDPSGSLATGYATFDITPVNDAPIISPTASFTTLEDTPFTFNATSGAVDFESNTLTVIASSINASCGSIVLDASKTNITFTPAGNTSGSCPFTYIVTDGQSALANATVTVNVSVLAVNDAPVAVNKSYEILEDTTLSVNASTGLLSSASDVETNSTLLVSLLVKPPAAGTLTLATDGSFTYTPAGNANGIYTFTYVLRDNDGTNPKNSSVATATINVTAVNDRPLLLNATILWRKSFTATIDPVYLFSDVEDGIDLDIERALPDPMVGTATIANGTILYTSDPTYVGVVTIGYKVVDGLQNVSGLLTLNISVDANNAPKLYSLATQTLAEDGVFTLTTENLADDVDGDALTVYITTNATSGTASVNNSASPATITYKPNANFNGKDLIRFSISDNRTNTTGGLISIVVDPVSDAPVASMISIIVIEDVRNHTISGLASDVDGQVLTLNLTRQPANGTATANNTAQPPVIVYTPTADFFGADVIEFTVTDSSNMTSAPGYVNITVESRNDKPVASSVTAAGVEDTPLVIAMGVHIQDVEDADGFLTILLVGLPLNAAGLVSGTANVTGQSINYYPALNAFGNITIRYNVADRNASISNTGTLTIMLAAANDAPVPVNDTAMTNEDAPVTIAVLGNDNDVDNVNADLFVASATADLSCAASVVINADKKTVVFTPKLNFNGPCTFTYTARDALSISTTPGTVRVDVNALNDAPRQSAALYLATAVEDTPLPLTEAQLLVGTEDAEGHSITIASVTAISSQGGKVAWNATARALIYTPKANFNGNDTITFTIVDNQTATVAVSASVILNVAAVDDPPVVRVLPVQQVERNNGTAVPKAFPMSELYNDVDTLPASMQLFVGSTAGVTGSVAVIGSGASSVISYTAALNANVNVTDSFQFIIGDATTNTTGRINVTITIGANNAPFALSPVLTTAEETALTLTAAQLFSDDVGDIITLAVTSASSAGSAVPNNTNMAAPIIVFTPPLNFVGTAWIAYTVTDAKGLTDPGNATIIVTNVNDVPTLNLTTSVSTREDTPVTIAGLVSDVDAGETDLAITIVGAVNGTAVANNIMQPPTILFTPTANFVGSARVTYSVTDSDDVTTGGVVTVTVSAVNDPPVPSLVSLEVPEGAVAYVIGAAGFELASDVENATLTLTITSSPLQGTATVNNTRQPPVIYYTPTSSNFNGPDSIGFTVSDGTTTVAGGLVSINVTAANDAPTTRSGFSIIARPGTPTAAGPPLTIFATLLADDVDAGAVLAFGDTFTGYTRGLVVLSKDKTSITYAVKLGVTDGTDVVKYVVTDGIETVAGNFTVVISSSGNNLPTTNPVTVTVGEDSTDVVISGLVEMDLDGDNITLSFAGGANSLTTAKGSAVVNNTVQPPTIAYTPALNAAGPDSFTYTASDGKGSVSGSVTIAITPGQDAPMANNVSLTLTAGSLNNVISNLVSDVDASDPLTLTITAQPAVGSVEVDSSSPTLRYSITNASYTGVVSIDFAVTDGTASAAATVTITILAPTSPATSALAAVECTSAAQCSTAANTCSANVCKCGSGDKCSAGLTCRLGVCVDLQTSELNCGSVANICFDTSDTCTAGKCGCGTAPACGNGRACVSGSCQSNQLTTISVAIVVRMDMDFDALVADVSKFEDFKKSYIALLAATLRVPASAIRIVSVTKGSVVIETEVFLPEGQDRGTWTSRIQAFQSNPGAALPAEFKDAYGVKGVTAEIRGKSKDEGLAGGAIAGIVIGVVVGTLLVALLAVVLYRRKQAKQFGTVGPAVKPAHGTGGGALPETA